MSTPVAKWRQGFFHVNQWFALFHCRALSLMDDKIGIFGEFSDFLSC
jgi:hypothetical protein